MDDTQNALEIHKTSQQLFQKGRLQKAYQKAVENKPAIDTIVKNVARETGGQYVTGLKDPQTAVKKVVTKNTEEPQRNYQLEDVNDLARARLIYPDKKAMRSAISLFKKEVKPIGAKVVKTEDFFKKPEDGYQGYHVDVQLPNKQHSEVQFHTQNSYANAMVTHGEHEQFGKDEPKQVAKRNEQIANVLMQLDPKTAQKIGLAKAQENAPQYQQGQVAAQQMATSPVPDEQTQIAQNVLNTTNQLRTQPAMGGGGQIINKQQYTRLDATPAGVGGGGDTLKKAISIVRQDPILNTKRDVPIKDIAGNKAVIKANEALTPHVLSSGNVLVKDGEEHLLNKGQYQNLIGNSVKAEKRDFAPELRQLEETDKVDSSNPANNVNGAPATNYTKFTQYTLPGGQNYREVLLQAPTKKLDEKEFIDRGYKFSSYSSRNPEKIHVSNPDGTTAGIFDTKADAINALSRFSTGERTYASPHWDEPNVLAHLRMNDRTTPDGKKTLFLEELQSDWANEGRRKGFQVADDMKMRRGELNAQMLNIGNQLKKDPNNTQLQGQFDAVSQQLDNLQEGSQNGVPNNPMLKNWRDIALKRALKEAVDGKYDYLSWTNGKQQADRYNLAKYVDNIEWQPQGQLKHVLIQSKDHGGLDMLIDKSGKVISSGNSALDGKQIDDVIGKDHAETIMKKNSGNLLPKDLAIGGEWAHNLYDKEVPQRLESLTGGKVENIGLDTTGYDLNKQGHPKVGSKSQQALKITPQVKAVVQGQGNQLKQPSGIMPSQYAPVNNAQQIVQDQNQLRTEPATQLGEGGGGNRKIRLVNQNQGYIRPPATMIPSPATMMNNTNFLKGIGGGGNNYSNALALLQAYQGNIPQNKGVSGYNPSVTTTVNRDFNTGGGGNTPTVGYNAALELLKRYPGIGGGGYNPYLNTRINKVNLYGGEI